MVGLCIENEISIVPIPGAVAAINALIISGLSTRRFAFEGFLSVNKRHRHEHLSSIKNDTHTLIFYEAPHKLKTTLKDLYEALGNRKISIIRELTKIHEEAIYTTLSKAQSLYDEKSPKGEFVLIIEGATEIEEEDNPLNSLSVREHVEKYIGDGLSQNEAIKKTASDRNVKKREIYNIYHEI